MKKEFLVGGAALALLVAAVFLLPRPGSKFGNDVSVASSVSYANAYTSEVSSPPPGE